MSEAVKEAPGLFTSEALAEIARALARELEHMAPRRPDRVLPTAEVCERLGCTDRTLRTLRVEQGFPMPIPSSGGKGWSEHAVEDWMREKSWPKKAKRRGRA